MQNEEQSQIKNKSSQNCCDKDGKCAHYSGKRRWLWIIGTIIVLAVAFKAGWYFSMKYYGATWDTPKNALVEQGAPSSTSARSVSEMEARETIDAIYKTDYRNAFLEKKPELFLKHIPDDFKSTSVAGDVFDAKGLRQFFPTRFANQIRTIEHNVTIEDVDVLPDGTISAIVTLYTLEEYKRVQGDGAYLVTTVGTYRDTWQERGGIWYEIGGDQLRNQVITAPRP